MPRLPEGTITFMLTDLQGSTQAWEKKPKAMRSAMARHDAILAATVGGHAGVLVEAGREGDSVLAVFKTAATAAACALEVQTNFEAESWPEGLDLKVRVALHTGEAQLRDGHYFGAALNRCARLLATCHPGQILVTKATEELLADEVPAGAELRDLGQHRLKDLSRPEQVFQLNDSARPLDFPRVQSQPQKQTNVPHYLTNFVGRATELTRLQALLANSRMVTLTGAGGSGKTRLAAELGRACLELWPGGVWWVDLAPINDAGQVAGAVVAALELPGRGPALDVVGAWLAARRAILVLDNCEHLVAACAALCQAALQRCAGLTIIATSREGLGVPGETRWPVSSMNGTDAARLFEARAKLVMPDYRVTAANLATVTQICNRLDCIPLAIELAAARVDLMSEQEILNQLSDSFHLLRGKNRTVPERQQTMIATIDWSYRLLTEEEAILYGRLSVFRGGFTLESANAVCAHGLTGRVVDVLHGLVQKSMVVAERPEGSASRCRILESQLGYAEDRLKESGQLHLTQRRHYEYFLDSLGATLGPNLTPPPPGLEQVAWIAREWGNLWAAAKWARINADDLGLLLAVRLAETEFPDPTARRSFLVEVLNHSGQGGVLRAKALRWAAALATIQGDPEEAIRWAGQSLAMALELGDVELVGPALLAAGWAYVLGRDLDSAAEMYDEATVVLQGSGNLPLITSIRNNVALLAVERGDYITARDILVKCVALARTDLDVRDVGAYLDSLAWAQLGLHEYQAATASWNEALSIASSVLKHRDAIYCFQGLSCVAGAVGDDIRALRLAAVAKRLSDEWSYQSEPWIRVQAEESERRSRFRLGAPKSEQAWSQGWEMASNQAVDYALGGDKPEPLLDADPLSRREREVATLVAAGLTNREIANRLFIAERSAEGHVERIRHKLGVRSRTEVATWAVEHGLTTETNKERGARHGPLHTRRG